jgi:hypothetical protein
MVIEARAEQRGEGAEVGAGDGSGRCGVAVVGAAMVVRGAVDRQPTSQFMAVSEGAVPALVDCLFVARTGAAGFS